MGEIPVGRQHEQITTYAKRRKKHVDSADLYTSATAFVVQVSCSNMVVARGHKHGERCEVFHDSLSVRGAANALQQFLQDDPGRIDRFSTPQGIPQAVNFRPFNILVASQCQRPDTCIYEQSQRRIRSRL